VRKLNANSLISEYRKPLVESYSDSWFIERVKQFRLLGVYNEVISYMKKTDMNPLEVIESAVTYLLTVGELKELIGMLLTQSSARLKSLPDWKIR
jgi:hypothetical protein